MKNTRYALLRLGLAVSLTFAATGAQAALITFDFGEITTGGLAGSGDSTAYLGSSMGFQISAFGYKGVELNDLGDDVGASFDDREAVVVDTSGGNRGLSVDSEGGPNGDDDEAGRLDGDGPDEALLFRLDFGGQLKEIVFDNFGGNDDFSLVLDDLVALVDVGNLANDTWSGSLAFNDYFAIGADGVNDAFRVRSVTIDVPAPAALGLIVLCIVGFGARRLQSRVLAK